MNSFFLSSKPFMTFGLGVVRIIFGILLIIHGTQMFHPDEMIVYGGWMRDLHLPFPDYLAYVGKIIEFGGGICLALGVFTRIASLLTFLTFMFISIVLGDGKILTDSQHAFMFGLMALIFFFHGAGPLSLSKK